MTKTIAFLLLATSATAHAAAPEPIWPKGGTDRPDTYVEPTAGYDYVKRVVEIPMRDGIKLHTVIVERKGAKGAPILLTRTPYDADKHAARNQSGNMASIVVQSADAFVAAGYILVYQDIRGQHKSEGGYVMTRPPIGPLNPTNVDNSTDAYDTIDWLAKNLPESNGRVGMIGSSYEGHTVVMALLNPHPALKVAAPESPMVDGWMGDDWFHYGAFRQAGNFGYYVGQESAKGADAALITSNPDDYDAYLTAGSAGDFAKLHGVEQFGAWRRTAEHPAYDAYWQGQATDRMNAANPSNVPTMWLQGLWDQEDMWGAIHSWEALKAAGHGANNYLVMGPWRHSQINYDGASLGPLKWATDTTLEFRRDVLVPFFNQYLKEGAPKFDMARVQIYNTGENHWDKFADWPLACPKGCKTGMTPIYLTNSFALSFDKPTAARAGDSYVADPAKPVPYVQRPVGADQWKAWLVSDQRPANSRTDVLSYSTPVLDHPVRISGAAIADLFAATTGTDGDWVVKLIDVYPTEYAPQPELGGYQLAVAMDIFRGRYRESFEHPVPAPANKVVEYKFALPTTNHVFQPGHRIMVQIQSSWFPLYDRNPQTYVPNIFFARPADYQKATITLSRSARQPSAVWLPLVDVAG